MKSTTVALLQKNKCYCLKKEKVIAISKCDLINCSREKKCRAKSNRDYEKSVKRNERGSKRKGKTTSSNKKTN